ncbi:hypothetical protein V8E53_014200 [Lactarius tabidus]
MASELRTDSELAWRHNPRKVHDLHFDAATCAWGKTWFYRGVGLRVYRRIASNLHFRILAQNDKLAKTATVRITGRELLMVPFTLSKMSKLSGHHHTKNPFSRFEEKGSAYAAVPVSLTKCACRTRGPNYFSRKYTRSEGGNADLALVTLPKRYVLEVLTGQANSIHAHFALVTGSDDISGSAFV